MKITSLTPREREVVELVAEHKTAKEIARELGIAVTTVRGYIGRIGRVIPGRGRPKERILVWWHKQVGERSSHRRDEDGPAVTT
jgi:DNA-binding CsgD family transcriptional regulator